MLPNICCLDLSEGTRFLFWSKRKPTGNDCLGPPRFTYPHRGPNTGLQAPRIIFLRFPLFSCSLPFLFIYFLCLHLLPEHARCMDSATSVCLNKGWLCNLWKGNQLKGNQSVCKTGLRLGAAFPAERIALTSNLGFCSFPELAPPFVFSFFWGPFGVPLTRQKYMFFCLGPSSSQVFCSLVGSVWVRLWLRLDSILAKIDFGSLTRA